APPLLCQTGAFLNQTPEGNLTALLVLAVNTPRSAGPPERITFSTIEQRRTGNDISINAR
ncbi:hypothetical protein, partial [Roseibium denhamense]|uniref:hypothetical protein n=1 Tax=Roseibium denhamense TaxID=76305 RepID=UPI001AD93BD2